ncbi:flippase [Natrialbaceae archaeon A-CW2]|uniref:flippase n=1 Tax=Natronosalvus amylolyticus TaxID=2961994 RepID=UPI0020C95E08|nr:flippase [Natronosalvus amylolyticus]
METEKADSTTDVTVGSLQSISRGASLFIIGKIVLDMLELLLNFILTRALGTSLYGVYAYAQTLVVIALVFTNLGSTAALLKFVPQYENDKPKQRFMVGLAYLTSFVASVTIAALLFLFAPVVTRYTLGDPLLTDVLRLFAILLVFDTMAAVVTGTFRSLERLEYSVFVNQFVKPVVRLLAVGFALALGLSFYGLMASLVFASVIVVAVAVYFFLTRFALTPSVRRSKTDTGDVFEYYNLSVPLVLKDAGGILRSRVDVLMVGFFLSSTAVGIYNVTLLLAALLALPLAGVNQLFPPVASRLYSKGDRENLNTIFSVVTRWAFTVSLYLALVAVLYSREMLGLFGEEFTAGAAVLAFFVVSQILNNAVGPSGYLLMISDHQYVLLVNQWVFGVLNVALNYYFILEFGLVGAAFATATVSALNNIARLVEIWYLEGLFPYTRAYLKPIFAGIGTAAAMYGVGFYLSGTAVVLLGGVIGLATYVALLYVLGVEQEDRAFLAASTPLVSAK